VSKTTGNKLMSACSEWPWQGYQYEEYPSASSCRRTRVEGKVQVDGNDLMIGE
jgi:hypothetical protein